MRRCFLTLGLLGLWTIAGHLAALDEVLIADPRSATFRDRGSERHWQALFDPLPLNPLRHLVALSLSEPDRYVNLVAARLLYRGDPWTRRGDESGLTATEWRRRCQPLLVAALRELRLRDDAGLERVDIALLGLDGDPELAIAATVDLIRRKPELGKAGALRIAIPTHAEALPASRVDEARRLARGLLVELFGIDDKDVRAALRTGIESGGARERNAALTLIPRAAADDLVSPALLRLCATMRATKLSDADLDGFALACDRLGHVQDAALAAALIALAIDGRREPLDAACALLARGLPADAVLPAEQIRTAAHTDSDPVRRNARYGLLLRRAPQVLAGNDAVDDSWRRLAEHRSALKRWESR